jgi:outer membrane protein OmpA-like peptidoglycan-associated protein
MAKCRPTKWVPWALLGAGLPLLAAYVTGTASLSDDIKSRAGQLLSANEQTAWAKLDNTVRDTQLSGTAPSQEALDLAVKTVAGTYGVRTVTNSIQIVEPVKMLAPTVESMTVTTATPEIKGTWHEGVADTLTVKVGETAYKLNENPELTSVGGNWLLRLTKPLVKGSYDVTAESSDGKVTMATAAPGKLVVNLPDPVVEVVLPAPTVENYVGNLTQPTFKGTWPEVAAKAVDKNLQVKLGETLFVLGKNPELSSDGSGNWQLVPSMPLLEGELQVMPGIVGADGKWQKADAPAKVVIDLTPPAAPELLPPAAGATWPFAITGRWPEVGGNSLAAALAGKVYEANKGEELKTDGKGNFTLDPKVELAPGSYDLEVTVKDAVGNVAKQTVKAAVVIPEPTKVEAVLPATPAVVTAPAADAKWPYAVTGTWDEKPGNTLSAMVDGRTYVLGRGAALTSDGPGKFSFAPSAKFAPGSYDVTFTTTDAAGVAIATLAKAAIVVPEPVVVVPPAPPPPPPVALVAAVVGAVPAGAVWPYAISGTWDDRPGNTLKAMVNGRTYLLGRGAALTREAAGTFNFAPSANFAPGSYDVDFITTDSTGATQVATAKAAIVIPKPAPVIPPPPPAVEIPSPTVISQLDLTGAPIIKGRWPNSLATNLNVTLDGRTYKLGTDGNLRTKDDTWTLFPATALKDGTYDVAVEASDAAGNVGKDATRNELEVDVTQPVAPTVMAASGDASPDHLSGTWDEAGAKSLKITVPQANITAGLGATGSPLTSDGAGKWRLDLATPLPPGSYDIIAESTDSRGRVQTDLSKAEVVIVAKGETPPPLPPPYDCLAVMNRIASVFPIRFEYDLTDITKPFDLSVSQYAALLKDPRCTSLNVEIKGHADFRGSQVYNMGLSERRAEVIKGMFEKAGVDAGRMTTIGFGKLQPLDPALTDEARAKNRRVEISVKP